MARIIVKQNNDQSLYQQIGNIFLVQYGVIGFDTSEICQMSHINAMYMASLYT